MAAMLSMSVVPSHAQHKDIPTSTSGYVVRSLDSKLERSHAKATAFKRERGVYTAGETMLQPENDRMVLYLGSEVSVALPADTEHQPNCSEDSALEISTADGNTYQVEFYEDGSVALTAETTQRADRIEFEYPLSAAGTKAIVPLENGAVLYMGADDDLVLAIAPPWAMDAAGKPLETWYEASTTALKQYVRVSPDTEFPIKADPWMGENLFKSITVDSYRNQPRVNLNLSGMGWAVYTGNPLVLSGLVGGQIILNNAGWREAVNWSSKVRKALEGKATMKQQFECHAAGALFAGEWNLERFRPTRTVTWVRGVGVHHCNWTSADLY